MYVDTHCHLYFEWFDQDRAAVLSRAWQAGLTRILLPGLDLETCQQALDLAEESSNLFVAVGVHPSDSGTWNPDTRARLKDMTQNPRVVAIGEIGLDLYHRDQPLEIQQKAFHEQLELAAEIGLPVVIHCREAFSALWPVLSAWQMELERAGSSLAHRPGVLHAFEGPASFANQAVEQHFYLGIGGPITYRKAEDKIETVQSTPLNHLLLETDAPFIAPNPFRGRRNEPAYIPIIAQKVAALKQLSVESVAQQTSANANLLFHWSVIA